MKFKVQALIDNHILQFDKTEPNVQQNPFPDHQVVGIISEEELDEEEFRLTKARHADKRFVREASRRGEIVDTLGQDSGGYNYRVLYSVPPSFFDRTEDIVPDGWGGMDDPVNEEEAVGEVDEKAPT